MAGAHGHFTDVAQTFHRKMGPKVGGKSMPKVDVSSAIPSCGRALPNALVEPDGLLRQLLRTPTPPARGLGSQALRQPRLRAVVASSSEGRVGALHAPRRDGVRAAASRASQRSRARPPECAGVRAGKGL